MRFVAAFITDTHEYLSDSDNELPWDLLPLRLSFCVVVRCVSAALYTYNHLIVPSLLLPSAAAAAAAHNKHSSIDAGAGGYEPVSPLPPPTTSGGGSSSGRHRRRSRSMDSSTAPAVPSSPLPFAPTDPTASNNNQSQSSGSSSVPMELATAVRAALFEFLLKWCGYGPASQSHGRKVQMHAGWQLEKVHDVKENKKGIGECGLWAWFWVVTYTHRH